MPHREFNSGGGFRSKPSPIWPGQDLVHLQLLADVAQVNHIQGHHLPRSTLAGVGVNLSVAVTKRVDLVVGYGYGINDVPEVELEEGASIFRSYGLPETTVTSVAQAIRSDRRRWIEFMMKLELGLDKPDPARARTSALTIAGSYIVGGLVPLAPYFVLRSMGTALVVSVLVTVRALLVFGYVKDTFTGKRLFRSAWQTAVVGGLAAAAAFAIAKLIA